MVGKKSQLLSSRGLIFLEIITLVFRRGSLGWLHTVKGGP